MSHPDPIPLARPDVGPLERTYVERVLDSPALAMGPWLPRFEESMAERTGARHAVAVSSGTAGLHLVVRALGLQPGDEVVTTPFSFVASSNCLLYEGAVPRFVDIDPETMNIDPSLVGPACTGRTRGILGVDVFGLPADWPALAELAHRRGLCLIADACESLGAEVGGRSVGRWGDAAVFGFYPNKQITTGEGGCITTDDPDLAAYCRSARNHGRASDARMDHVRLGFNYRLDELSAALGCAQLERLPELLERRARVAARYSEALADLADDLILPAATGSPADDSRRSWFVYVVRLRESFAAEARNRLIERLQAAGIGCAPYFPCIHLQPYYRRRFGFQRGDFPVSEAVADRTIALPFYTALHDDQIDRVARSVREALAALPRQATTVR